VVIASVVATMVATVRAPAEPSAVDTRTRASSASSWGIGWRERGARPHKLCEMRVAAAAALAVNGFPFRQHELQGPFFMAVSGGEPGPALPNLSLRSHAVRSLTHQA
jgi:hypothetical protein